MTRSLLTIAMVYVASYKILSAQGRYQNACWRAHWPGKRIVWVPRGFVAKIYQPDAVSGIPNAAKATIGMTLLRGKLVSRGGSEGRQEWSTPVG